MKHIISIIIPIYQAEKYLSRCLNSIIAQTFTDWECILVDDGSTDEGGKNCDEYTRRDKRFNVIHKANEGVSIARQTGLDAAKGEYVIHADPDDWVEQNWLQSLYEEAVKSNADMTICDFERVYNDKIVYYDQKPNSLNSKDVLHDMLIGKLWGPCWNKLIKKDCFDKWNVRFVPSMNLWEDLYVNSMLLLNGATVSHVPLVLYHYDSFTNCNSIVMHRKDAHISSGIYLINNLQYKLSDDYDDCIYYLKSRIKAWIFFSNETSFNIVNTYSEINERYIDEARRKPFCSNERFISLCVKGHSRLGHLIFNIANCCINLYHIIK